MVDNCVSGYNSCMFAYGQTGSGKTHTMLGDIEGGTRRHSVNCGMTPRVFEYLFSKIQKEKECRREEKLQFTCKCSFLEIYNEQILDLLDPSSLNLQIREDAKRGVHVENLKEFEVTSARDVMQQLLQGAANRKVAATNMNRASSRSHSVFTCVIESKWESQGITHHRFSRLNLVDLAGSERQKSSGAEGERLREATNINKSLSTLGLVIMNLVSMSKQKSLHVPYRDSKLTFILQDSLGGNSKTIIIANISPSNCCALETLSTLKFAQRAKFIRNNAIINEEASGDVLNMRLEIQQLKKEINRLRCLVHGGTENQENENLNASFSGSPGSFKWEGVQAFSPLTFDKRIPLRNEYEAALVAAFMRDRDKETELKALSSEKAAAEQLASQRTDEVQGLKMRLRFREEGIRRLEAVASGKLSAESHLLREKEELLKEIEVLRNQVDRNPEVTRFAMENLRLKEELRRLQSFVEEGERERMNEQITALQEKLLEALDWKLMHEKGVGVQDLSLSWDSSINEENEFLRLQAIQNQREVEALRKNLNFCLEAKEKLERHVDELIVQLEDEKKMHNTLSEARQPQQIGSQIDDDQTELKTMVDAIAAASQREAEAHETAIRLAKENEELRLKLNVLIEDNNKLIELYENAVSEGVARMASKDDFEASEDQEKGLESLDISQGRKDIEDLENQLHEMHEENEKLMSLYEQAMQEKDEFKRLLHEQQNGLREEEISCFEKLVPVDNKVIYLQDKGGESSDASNAAEFVNLAQEKLGLVRTKLDMVHDKLATVEKVMDSFGLLEKSARELNNFSEKVQMSDGDIQSKQEEIALLKIIYGETQGRVYIMDNKLVAAKFALQNLAPEMDFWREREERARTKVDAHTKSVEQKKKELEILLSQKEKIVAAYRQASQSETQLRDKVSSLKSAYKIAEGQREETKKVLFAIDNLAKADIPPQRAGQYGKAFELLKSEEEVTKLAAEVQQLREKIATVQKEAMNSRKMSEEIDNKLKDLEEEMRSEATLLEKAENDFQNVKGEREVISATREEGIAEFWNLVVDYQENVFLLGLKKTEIHMHEDELQLEIKTVEELKTARSSATQKLNVLLDECERIFLLSGADDSSQCTGEKVVELGNMQGAILEARSLLFDRNDDR